MLLLCGVAEHGGDVGGQASLGRGESVEGGHRREPLVLWAGRREQLQGRRGQFGFLLKVLFICGSGEDAPQWEEGAGGVNNQLFFFEKKCRLIKFFEVLLRLLVVLQNLRRIDFLKIFRIPNILVYIIAIRVSF